MTVIRADQYTSRRVKDVLLDGHRIGAIATACDPDEGWVDTFPIDPKTFQLIPGRPLRLYGRVQVVWRENARHQ